MKQITMLLASAMLMPISAFAAVNLADYKDIELGVEYTLEFKSSFYGKFTPTESGQIIEFGNIPVFVIGENDELTQMNEGYEYAGYINGKQAYQFSVTAGTTYFFVQDFIINSGVFSIEMNPEVKMVKSYPELNSVYDPAANAYIDLIFNQNLTVTSAEVTVGETLKSGVDLQIYGSSVSVVVNDILRSWYNQDAIKGGEKLTVILKGITDGIGNPVADITAEFIAASKPVELESMDLPVEIMSWYAAGSETPSKAVFTFTGNIQENPKVQLCYAPVELGYEYIEDLTAEVKDNVMTVDFAGTRRASSDMSTSGRNDDVIYLRILSLKDASGQTVWSPGQGTIGSFLYEIPFTEIPRLNITSEFTPSMGATLEGVNSIKIYFDNNDKMAYSGVAFTSGTEKAVVKSSDITVDQISASEVELTVPVPAGWSTKENVIVTLEDLVTNDGYDHSGDIRAKFNGFTITFCNIKNGDSVKSFAKNSIVKIETNLKDDATVNFSVVNKETGNTVFGPELMTAGNDGIYTLTFAEDVVLEKGVEYTILFTANPGGDETLTVAGATEPYAFSDVTFSAVTPEDGSEIPADATISVEFDGMVSISAVNGSAPFTAVEGEGAVSGYCNIWNLTLTNPTEDANATVKFNAVDMDGLVVEGNAGTDANSYFEFTFKVTCAGIVEVSTASEGSNAVYNLQGIKVKNPSKGLYIINGRKVIM